MCIRDRYCNVKMGSSYLRQEGKVYKMSMHSRNIGCDLTFQGTVPGWKIGDGQIPIDGGEIIQGWVIPCPRAKVEGKLFIKDKEIQVKGDGYHDHNWGNVALPSVLDHWYWGRAHVGEYSLIFVEQIAAKKYGYARIPVFLLAKGEQVLADDSRYFTMEARDPVHHCFNDGHSLRPPEAPESDI